MNKLTVGIILKEGYTPELGGGFSYYDSVVEAIDHYEFNPELEFRFITFKPIPANKFRKQVDLIIVRNFFSRKESLLYKFIRLLKRSPWLYKRRFSTKLKRKLQQREHKHLVKALIDSRIDILYNIVPFAQFLDYPFVETHWDLGHLSMYAFPEVTMNSIFEKRDRYYSDWISKAFAIFCESQAGKKELVRYKPMNPDRVFVVPMFAGKITAMNLSPAEIDLALQKYSLTPGGFFFYPAQFWSHKNHYGLVHS